MSQAKIQKTPSTTQPRYITTELGTEKRCIHCSDYFPLDKEFWWHNGHTNKDGTKSWCACCKGCYDQRYVRKRNSVRTRRNNIKGVVEGHTQHLQKDGGAK